MMKVGLLPLVTMNMSTDQSTVKDKERRKIMGERTGGKHGGD